MLKSLIKHKIKKFSKKNEREKIFMNWNEIKNILVLFDTEDYENVDLFIKVFKKQNKKVQALALKNTKDTHDYSYTPYIIMTQKETKGWTGKSIDELIEPLVESNFDLVIDLTLQEQLPLIYMLAQANASLKIGYKKPNFSLYDITITYLSGINNPDLQPVKELARHIVHYLSIIGSKL